MRSFFRSHWKVIVGIVLLILLALVTVNPRAAPHDAPLALRLQAHAAALQAAGLQADAAARRAAAAAYVTDALRLAGYRVTQAPAQDGGAIEASLGNVPAGTRPARTFLIGARIDPARLAAQPDAEADADGGAPARATVDDPAADAAAVLELARLLKHVRPGQGSAIRFAFFLDESAAAAARAGRDPERRQHRQPAPGSGSFIAFVGTLAASRPVRDALAAFQGASAPAGRGLAAPAYVQGVTLADRAAYRDGGAGPALMITDTSFTSYPYRHVRQRDGMDAPCPGGRAPDERHEERPAELPEARPAARRDYDGLARVVAGLARTVTALAAARQG
ncbi:hypothetical protein [uncultured Massilia sp.]|uniref:hypothetical protein n=1 Tax=uncultured Massilia sp. TaxID=169973 RepID=UPI0025CBEDC9|nr:hypothetical protein [uncultured Massilia sp.]